MVSQPKSRHRQTNVKEHKQGSRRRSAEQEQRSRRRSAEQEQGSRSQSACSERCQSICGASNAKRTSAKAKVFALLERVAPGAMPTPGDTIRMARLRTQVAAHIQHMWAGSTWSGYGNLWARYLTFCVLEELELDNDTTAALFVVSTETSVQGQHQYAKTMHALFRRFGWDAKILSLMAAGLRHEGALIPMKQAPPIDLPSVLELRRRENSPWFGVMIAWSTASRWDDVVPLKKESFLESTPTRSIIDWSDQTKSSRADPFRASSYTVIAGSLAAEIHREWCQLATGQNITTMTTKKLDQWMEKQGLIWRGHSFKRGAATHLVCMAAQEKFDMKYLPILLKHKTINDFNSTTIRYVGGGAAGKIALAVALGTQHATQLL